MNEVIIVHLLGVDDVTVLLLAQVLGVNAVGSQELLISDTESLADRLGDELGLQTNDKINTSDAGIGSVSLLKYITNNNTVEESIQRQLTIVALSLPRISYDII